MPRVRPPAARLSGIAAALLVVLASRAPATTLRHLDTRELTLDSHEIVIGEVESTTAHWDAKHSKILTDVTVRVTQSLKGDAGDRLVLTQLGGEVDGVRYDIPGCPVFRPGQSSVFFVWRSHAGVAQVNAMAEGKFDIATDAATGERTVQRSAPGFAVRDLKTLRSLPAGQPAPALKLDTLLREVRRTLAETSNR